MFYCFCWIEILGMVRYGKERRENDSPLPLSPSSLHSRLWSYCTSLQWKDLSVLLTPPIYVVLTTIWCPVLVICHVCWFLSIQPILINSDIKCVNKSIILMNCQINLTCVELTILVSCLILEANTDSGIILCEFKRMCSHYSRLSLRLTPDTLLSFTKKIWKELVIL